MGSVRGLWTEMSFWGALFVWILRPRPAPDTKIKFRNGSAEWAMLGWRWRRGERVEEERGVGWNLQMKMPPPNMVGVPSTSAVLEM